MKTILICLLFLPLQNAISQVAPAKHLELDTFNDNRIRYSLSMPTGNTVSGDKDYADLFGGSLDEYKSSGLDDQFKRIILDANFKIAMAAAKNRSVSLELENLAYKGQNTWNEEANEVLKTANNISTIFSELQDNPNNEELVSRLKCTLPNTSSHYIGARACRPLIDKILKDFSSKNSALKQLDKNLKCSAKLKKDCSASTLLRIVLLNMASDGVSSPNDFRLRLTDMVNEFDFYIEKKEYVRKRSHQKQSITFNELKKQLVALYENSIQSQLQELTSAKDELKSLLLEEFAKDPKLKDLVKQNQIYTFRPYINRDKIILNFGRLESSQLRKLRLKHTNQYLEQLRHQTGQDIIKELEPLNDLNNQAVEARSNKEVNSDTKPVIVNQTSVGEIR